MAWSTVTLSKTILWVYAVPGVLEAMSQEIITPFTGR
jgi:hypothetical protein